MALRACTFRDLMASRVARSTLLGRGSVQEANGPESRR